MSKKLLLIGAGGHCASVIDSLMQNNDFDSISLVDRSLTAGTIFMGFEVLGGDDKLATLKDEGYTHAFITVGSIKDTTIRERIYSRIKGSGFLIPVIIDPTAIVSKNTVISEGVFIGKNVVINTMVSIDSCAIINTSSTIEHNCHIGKFSHIAPGSVLCGDVSVGDFTHIGASSVVRQSIKIGNHVLVGLGSVVISDMNDFSIVYGNPAKEAKK